MHQTTNNNLIEKPSEKSFGVVFSIVFLVVALFSLFNSKDYHIWALIVAAIFLLLAYLAPKTLTILNKIWFKFGLLLGSIVSKIILMAVYFFTVLPIGFMMRFFGKDLLKQKLSKKAKSYWIERTDSTSSMKNQF